VPSPAYIATGVGAAVAITVTLRAVPFGMKKAMKDSRLLDNLGRWMPLGAVTILATYCLATVDLTAPTHGVPELAGVVTTIAVHAWRRNAVLSIVAGTATCLILTNWVLPA
jgi:branched-subunit amino acid transport protein AzlD